MRSATISFSWYKVPFSTDFQELQEISLVFLQKGWDSPKKNCTMEERSAVLDASLIRHKMCTIPVSAYRTGRWGPQCQWRVWPLTSPPLQWCKIPRSLSCRRRWRQRSENNLQMLCKDVLWMCVSFDFNAWQSRALVMITSGHRGPLGDFIRDSWVECEKTVDRGRFCDCQ